MTISDRDRRALLLLAAGLVLIGIYYYFSPGSTPSTVAAPNVNADTIGLAQQRLVRLRQIAATAPAREAAFKQASAELRDRELGMIQAETAPQAQAALLEVARRIGKNEQIEVRGGDFGAPKVFGDYALVYATVTFECHVEQIVNFLADLSREQEIVVPSEERIVSANPKDKTMNVRMVLAGLVARKLVPDKKGLGGF